MKATQQSSNSKKKPKSVKEVLNNLRNQYNEEIMRVIELNVDFETKETFFETLKAFLYDKEEAHIINKIFNSTIENISVELDLYKRAEQSIIKTVNRPVFLINNDLINPAKITTWKHQIKENMDTITNAIKSVGRIEIKGEDEIFIGTGWLIKNTNIIVTNRHVADEFAERKEAEFTFKKDWMGYDYNVRIDFKEENTTQTKLEFDIKGVIYWGKGRHLDIALLSIDKKNYKEEELPVGLEISEEKPNLKTEIYVIGYPSCHKPHQQELKNKYFNSVTGKKQFAPGYFTQTGASKYIYRHDCTTWAGNSGSPVIDFKSGKVLGIHYAGIHENHAGHKANYAVSSLALKEILDELDIFYKH